MLRILHVVTTMDLGGVETLLMDIYRNIDRETLQFDFLCMNTCNNYFSNEIKNLGGQMYAIPFISKVGYGGYKRELNRFFENHREYRIVHTHVNSYNGYILDAAKKASIPVRISHAHAVISQDQNFLKSVIEKIGRTKIENGATDYLACSKEAASSFYGNRRKDVIILKNGINTDKFLFDKGIRNEIRECYNASNQFVIGHVGRFDNLKNQIMVVKVFESYVRDHSDAVLWLIGNGPEKNNIEKYIFDHGIEDKVLFWGVRPDVNKLMFAMDVFLFPSVHEGLGLVAIEAQASGLPVIASTGVPKDTNVTGLIQYIPLDEFDTWLKALGKCSYNIRREEFCKKIREAGYDIKDVTEMLVSFYMRKVNKNNYGR